MLLRSQPGFLPFRSFSLHINAASGNTWVSIVVYFHRYRTVFWGRSNGSTCFVNFEITCGSNCMYPRFEQRAATHRVFGMRRGIPRSQSSLDLGSRQIR
ncbi:hypothetical protein TcCL_ESM05119, partial [Trypanosoma cruzi]